MVKKVDVNETLLKVYNDKELVNYIATELKRIQREADVDDSSWTVAAYGSLMRELQVLGDLTDALNKRMNKDSNDPKIIV